MFPLKLLKTSELLVDISLSCCGICLYWHKTADRANIDPNNTNLIAGAGLDLLIGIWLELLMDTHGYLDQDLHPLSA